MSDMTPEKLWPIGGYAPGNYSCICLKCGQTHIADKRAFHCADCMLQAQAAEITRLRAQVEAGDKLAEAAETLRDDMMQRAECKMDTISGEQYRVVNAGNGAWTGFRAALATYQQKREGGE